MEHNKRKARRDRHRRRADTPAEHPPRDFATAGQERDTLPRRDAARDPKTLSDFEGGSGGGGFGREYGQGFGIGPGHGVESSAQGLEGSPRERDYRGNAGTTFGATVGPDALKPDTAADKREDPNPNVQE